jgi:hypothetical protein
VRGLFCNGENDREREREREDESKRVENEDCRETERGESCAEGTMYSRELMYSPWAMKMVTFFLFFILEAGEPRKELILNHFILPFVFLIIDILFLNRIIPRVILLFCLHTCASCFFVISTSTYALHFRFLCFFFFAGEHLFINFGQYNLLGAGPDRHV